MTTARLPTKALQPITVPHVLAGGLRALREDEDELLLVVEEPHRVLGTGRHAAGAGPQRADDGQGSEQVLREAVDRPAELAFDPVHDDGRVRRNRPAMVADQQRAAVARNAPEAFPFDAEPAPVYGPVKAASQCAGALAAPPVVDVAESSSWLRRVTRVLTPERQNRCTRRTRFRHRS